MLRKAEKRYINVINYYYYYIVLPFSLVLSVHYSNLLCVRHCLLALSTSPVIRRILSQVVCCFSFSSVPSLVLPCPVLSCRLRSWSAPFSCHVARPVQHLQNLECGVAAPHVPVWPPLQTTGLELRSLLCSLVNSVGKVTLKM